MSTPAKRKTKDWTPVIKQAIVEIQDFNNRGIKPTLRTLFYRLFSKDLLENNKYSYGYLSEKIVNEKKRKTIPWDALSDNVRVTKDEPKPYEDPQRYITRGTTFLKHAHETYSLPRWYNQPHYVEIWTEKDAMVGTLQSILQGREIAISVNRGNDSWTHLHESVQRIKKYYELGKHTHILYVGDYDPSGVAMDADLWERLNYFCLEFEIPFKEFVDFRRFAVTKEQIHAYRLPKLQYKKSQDKNIKKFMEKNGGEVFAVELDALPAYIPDEFKRLVLQEVDRWFSNDIYEATRAEESRLRETIKQQVAGFAIN